METIESKQQVLAQHQKKKRPKSIITPYGCILKPTGKGRCKHANQCVHFSDCLTLACEFETGGFSSDNKGFVPISEIIEDGWNDSGDYSQDYKIHI